MAATGTNQYATSVALTGDTRIDGLLSGYKWGLSDPGSGISLTYSFPSGSAWFAAHYGSGETTSWNALTATQGAAFEAALGTWASVANISLSGMTESATQVGDIRAATTGIMDRDFFAWAYLPGNYTEAGDVWLNAAASSNDNPGYGTEGFVTMVHEIGHSFGLEHPFEGAVTLSAAEDNYYFTVMSYDYTTGITPITPMPYDILAVQYLYGANTTTGAGDNVYTLKDNGYAQTIWDSGGTDLFDASALSQDTTINLHDGQYTWTGSTSLYAIAYNTVIESATGGAGADVIVGNSADNYLGGGSGADQIAGGTGADVLVGNRGNDTLYGEQGGDLILGGKGQDWAHGGLGSDVILGDLGDDQLHGATGADTILGGSGADTIGGNLDNDVLLGQQGEDLIYGGQGNDWLQGGEDADTLYGGLGDDVLIGGDGENHLYGGDGADVFYIDANDVIQDLESIDTVLDWSLLT